MADIARVKNGFSGGVLFTWGSIVDGSNADYEFIIEETGVVVDYENNAQGLFHLCEIFSGLIFSIVGTNLYMINTTLDACSDTTVRMEYTGLATTRNELGTDEALVFMMTSGDYSFSSDFQ